MPLPFFLCDKSLLTARTRAKPKPSYSRLDEVGCGGFKCLFKGRPAILKHASRPAFFTRFHTKGNFHGSLRVSEVPSTLEKSRLERRFREFLKCLQHAI